MSNGIVLLFNLGGCRGTTKSYSLRTGSLVLLPHKRSQHLRLRPLLSSSAVAVFQTLPALFVLYSARPPNLGLFRIPKLIVGLLIQLFSYIALITDGVINPISVEEVCS